MYKNSFQNQNDNFKLSPYRAKNMIVAKAEAPTQPPPAQQQPQQPPVQQQPAQQQPAPPTPVEQQPAQQPATGSLAVGVFTALQALPVRDAIVTVYDYDADGNENAIYHRVTDQSGRVPDMELPVVYDPNNPLVSPDFYFSTYNLRVQAINYYTQNVLEFRIFPGVKTNLRINMIPVIQGQEGTTAPSRTIVIPPSPIDISN